jgi:cation:H+ antiporter
MPESGLIVALLGGLVLMAFAGDFLVNGAVAIGRKLGLSPLIAGIFIVGFGTSAPEMLVAIDAARNNYPNLALGNIVGSNIANIFLVLALPAIISPIVAGGWGQGRSYIFMLAATFVWIAILSTIGLDVAMGTLFIIALILYAVFTLVSARMAKAAGIDTGIDVESSKIGTARASAYILIGMIGLPIGARLIVDSGVDIARFYNVREELIGLTLLAVGTSLPEIGAGIAAALRKKTDVLVGNVLGSNLFNILGAGGLIAFFGPIEAAQSFANYDHWIMAAAALIIGLFIFAKMRIGRLAGILLLLIYSVYIYGLVNGWNILALTNG